jgi:hypothetical protein
LCGEEDGTQTVQHNRGGLKKVKQKVVKLLAVRGVKVYKWSNWTYCISGVKPSGSHEMTIPYCYSLKSTLKQWLSLRSYPEEKALVKQN